MHSSARMIVVAMSLSVGCSRAADPGQPATSASAAAAASEAPTPYAVVAGMLPLFRKCRADHLADSPDMAGSVEVVFDIDEAGRAIHISANPTGTITRDVAACVADHVASARFPPAANGKQGFKVPIPLGNDAEGGETSERAVATRVVGAMKDDIRQCYAEALATNTDASGRLVAELAVDASGHVQRADVVSRQGNLPPAIDGCVLRLLGAATFPPHADAEVFVRVPITFRRSP